MKWMLDVVQNKPDHQVSYADHILLTGSCFSEHIGNSLSEYKFNVLQNPNGILYDPFSICNSLVSYIQNKQYEHAELFQLNELWNSWQHHTRYSGMHADDVLSAINQSQTSAHEFLQQANWLIITLGTAYSYHLTDSGMPVANCHRAPGNLFYKHLMGIEEINTCLDNCIHQLFHFNKDLKIIFTVSPVRHIKDGLIENNRSKARLIEVVHHLVNKFDKLYYFPAYEIVIDSLRDYRFYDTDLVHPNQQATQYVFDRFIESFVDEKSKLLYEEIRALVNASKHRPFNEQTQAHQKFKAVCLERAVDLQQRYGHLNFRSEIEFFRT